MFELQTRRFLRTVMLLDAASVLLSGVPQLLATGWLARWSGLPVGVLWSTGLFLLVYGALACWIGTRRPIPASLVQLVIAGNLAWGVGCIVLLVAGPFAPSYWGTAYLLLHLVAVVVFAALQWSGLRRLAAATRLAA